MRCLILHVKSAITVAVFLVVAFLSFAAVAAQLVAQAAPDQDLSASAQASPDVAPTDEAPYAKLSSAQLDRLVAPIALYPDALVAQILSSSTFPTQITDAEDFLIAHPGLSTADLGQQLDQQPWDPSVKALAQFPSVLANLSKNLGWTSELGDAYFNQQEDVMKSVQEMRKKAKKAGNLKSTGQMNVEGEDGRIDIDPVDSNIVYVPAYDPWLVYGYPIAPWPYWVDVPGIWWDGPGLYFGIGFPIAPYFGYGWGWHWWGVDWHHRGIFFHGAPYYARGPAFFDRGGYYGGRRGFEHMGGYREWMGDRRAHRGYTAPREGSGMRSGAFSGINQGGVSRGFSARGQGSSGGFHGGGFGGGGFHSGGGGGRH